MKIGFDVAQTCMEKAGCAWYADSLARALVKAAPEHEFFLYHQFGGFINHSTANGTVIDAPNATPTFTDVSPAEAARIWGSPDELYIKTGGPDIVHANCYRAPRVPGARLVYTVYDVSFWAVPEYTTEANRLICQQGTLEAVRNADGFIFISASSHEEFDRILPGWLSRSGRPWVVTPLGSKQPAADGTPVVPSAGHWLAVGSLEPRKNYETLLTAMEIYWEQSTRRLPLRIAGGSGWKSDELKTRIRGLQERGLVSYLGYVPDEELPDLYAGAEALIFPSWYEGFGLPVLEAMNCGCPVICSDRTSLKEVGGDSAFYVSPERPQEIVAQMLKLEGSDSLRASSRQKAVEQARRFSWEKAAGETLEFYQRVLG